MRRIVAVVMILGAAALGAPGAYAACGGSTPMFHSSTFFQCADTTPVAAYAWQLSAPATTNTGTLKIACEAFNGDTCLGNVGTLGDGAVDIETDWANTGINGCPLTPTPTRVAIAVQDASGNGLIVSISGATNEFGYQVDMAHPLDLSTFSVLPLACSDANGKPHINSVSTSSISLTFKRPVIFSDCDPNSLGVQAFALGLTATPACTDNFTGSTAATLGGIYTSVQTCGTFPNVQKNVPYAPLKDFQPVALIASACAIVGAMIGLALPTNVVQTALGATILGIVALMLVAKKSEYPDVQQADNLSTALRISGIYHEVSTGQNINWKIHRTPQGLATFVIIGVMAGMFGLGAGWANVPVLNLMMGAPLKVSVATSKFLLSITDTSAAWIYVNNGAVLPMLVVPSIIGIMLGSIVGVRLLAVAKPTAIRHVVIGLLLFASVRALLKGLEIWN